MFAYKNQQTVAAPVKSHHIGVRRKHAMKKSMANSTQPVVGHTHHIKRHRQNVVMGPQGKLSLFQRIKLAIMTRLRSFTKRPMIAAAPAQPVVATTGHKHHLKRHM